MDTWTRSVVAFGRSRPARIPITVAGLVLGAGILIASPISASAHVVRTAVPTNQPPIPGTQIACFDRKADSYVGEVRPPNCDFAGKVEFKGFLHGDATENSANGSFVSVPIRGFWDRIEWNLWGAHKAEGRESVNARNGSRVRVIPSGRTRCADGSTWYSRAGIFNLDSAYAVVIRLPVCGDGQ
jgi:hypothetical protein